MKKQYFIFLVLLLLICKISYGQSRLEVTRAYIENLNSLRIGDSLTFVYTLKNTGTVKYADAIKTYLYTNLDTVPMFKNTPLAIVDTAAYDTVQLRINFPVQPPHFQPNKKSIIVIWPTGTGTTIKMDTFVTEEIIVKQSLSVTEQKNMLSYVRFYPNPTNGILRIERQGPDVEIKSIKIYDISGKAIHIKNSGFNEPGLDMSDFKAGIYFLELDFTRQETRRYRIIKTD